jgi:hypothetical protein
MFLGWLCGLLWSAAAISSVSVAPARRSQAENVAPSPEMERLASVLVGTWNTTESMEPSEQFPSGGGRRGTSRWRLTAGGAALVGEGSSDGSAGPLSYAITIWWDESAKTYGFFTCFKDSGGSGCRRRGSARWIDDDFVNDYQEVEHGKPTKWRDAFTQITPSSHTLLAGRLNADGTLTTLITSRSTRQ